jgi:erythronate-4-phosphate dehydrogenase
MRLVADENMPLVAEFFAGHEVRRLPGRGISRADLLEADALLVRSVTRVDRALLADTPVRFVGTATIGTDHIDLAGLGELGVLVASAPGCNARAVGEYVATALACLAADQGWRPEERTLGVVGLGNTGRQVVALAQAMGFRVLGCDPFEVLPGVRQLAFAELRAEADILSLHVPLTRGGTLATYHLVDADVLAGLPAGAILVNACRGEVVDGQALASLLAARADVTAVLDVWEGEPRIVPALLEQVRLGSPHVAGYTQEGKWRGTEMVYRAFCDFAGMAPQHSLSALLAGVPAPAPLLTAGGAPAELLRDILLQACPLLRDDAALRQSMVTDDRGAAFDEMRRCYPPRREFTAHRVALPEANALWPLLTRFGFRPA